MKKIRLSKHFMQRWNDRVNLKWKVPQIANYIHRHFIPQLHQGIKPYIIEKTLYYVFSAGKLNEKMVFIVLTPGSEGLWSGWYAITVLTDDVIDSINDYFEWLKKKSERKDIE